MKIKNCAHMVSSKYQGDNYINYSNTLQQFFTLSSPSSVLASRATYKIYICNLSGLICEETHFLYCSYHDIEVGYLRGANEDHKQITFGY